MQTHSGGGSRRSHRQVDADVADCQSPVCGDPVPGLDEGCMDGGCRRTLGDAVPRQADAVVVAAGSGLDRPAGDRFRIGDHRAERAVGVQQPVRLDSRAVFSPWRSAVCSRREPGSPMMVSVGS